MRKEKSAREMAICRAGKMVSVRGRKRSAFLVLFGALFGGLPFLILGLILFVEVELVMEWWIKLGFVLILMVPVLIGAACLLLGVLEWAGASREKVLVEEVESDQEDIDQSYLVNRGERKFSGGRKWERNTSPKSVRNEFFSGVFEFLRGIERGVKKGLARGLVDQEVAFAIS